MVLCQCAQEPDRCHAQEVAHSTRQRPISSKMQKMRMQVCVTSETTRRNRYGKDHPSPSVKPRKALTCTQTAGVQHSPNSPTGLPVHRCHLWRYWYLASIRILGNLLRSSHEAESERCTVVDFVVARFDGNCEVHSHCTSSRQRWRGWNLQHILTFVEICT